MNHLLTDGETLCLPFGGLEAVAVPKAAECMPHNSWLGRLAHHMPRPMAAVQALRRPAPPPSVAHLYSDEDFAKKRAYNLEKLRYGMVHGLWDFLVNTAFLLAGYLPWTWGLAGGVLARCGWGGGGELAQSVAWVLIQVGAGVHTRTRTSAHMRTRTLDAASHCRLVAACGVSWAPAAVLPASGLDRWRHSPAHQSWCRRR